MLAVEQLGGDAHPDQARCTYSVGAVHIGKHLSVVSTTWTTHQAAADALSPGHRDVDQSAEDPLCSLVLTQSRQKGSSN